MLSLHAIHRRERRGDYRVGGRGDRFMNQHPMRVPLLVGNKKGANMCSLPTLKIDAQRGKTISSGSPSGYTAMSLSASFLFPEYF
jgi:hypothetical protein